MPTSPFQKLTFYLDTDEAWDSMRRKLVGHRQCMRWTQAEIAERMGISQATFSNLESGKSGDPYVSTIQRWLRALEFEPHLDFVER